MADRAEGIAGLTWAQNSIVRPQPLPDVANTTNEAVLQEFANKTNVSLAWVKERRPAARSYCGLPVSVDGNLWGVLVFDSRQPDIMDVEKVQHALEAFAKTLSPLLRRF
jgi:putative methionine-R-sulfoxide reductase with GAF domain